MCVCSGDGLCVLKYLNIFSRISFTIMSSRMPFSIYRDSHDYAGHLMPMGRLSGDAQSGAVGKNSQSGQSGNAPIVLVGQKD